ncbi:Uncharacterised protein [Acinetobacter baumannii]|nr:Uncharacterised protein [Acinetobacter baumannii]SVK01889.1 Uncharacterised protein [Acinetobacter baumannii]
MFNPSPSATEYLDSLGFNDFTWASDSIVLYRITVV